MAKTKLKINADQENFCQLFVTQDTEFYGNGTMSYLESYDRQKRKSKNGGIKTKPMSYKTAASNAYKLLKKPEICQRINELLEAQGFNNENVDKQHLFLLNQFADLKTKLGAVKEYNVLKKRVDNSIPIGELKITFDDAFTSKTKGGRPKPSKV